jgi:hypothetical protein
MTRQFYLSLLVLICSSAMGESDLKNRMESQPVGEVWRDEASGITRVFLQKNAGTIGVPGWNLAQSKGCGFKVQFFGRFSELKQEGNTTDGSKLAVVSMGNHIAEGTKFAVTCLRRSDNTIKSGAISETSDSFAASGVVVSRGEVMRSGYRAQRVKLRRTSTEAVSEMFQLGPTLYQLIVEYPKSEAETAPAMAERFFASFRP